MKIKSIYFNIIFSLFTIVAFNGVFFEKVYTISQNLLFTGLMFFSLVLLFNAACSILCFKGTTKFWAMTITLINASVFYFINTYNIAIDSAMLLNILETDRAEALSLLNTRAVLYFLILGVLPAGIIAFTKVEYKSFFKELVGRILIILISMIIVAGIVFGGYKTTAQFLRNNRPVRYFQVPMNYFGATLSLYKSKKNANREFVKIGEDAKLQKYWNNYKPNLFVFMVGETARAANFSLYGYKRRTNEPLEKYKKDLIVFQDFDACATSTAIALPCIFSKYGRKDFKANSGKYTENVLDIIQKIGYKVLWKENNSSCKDNCKRVETIDFQQREFRFDEVLLGDFDKIAKNKNTMIVLHTQGSHGPKYYLRSPQEAQKYLPICQTELLDKCSREEIVNIYDNSIYYTSQVLAKTIEELKALKHKYNVVFIYVSDHGESLGENNIYLHAAPYAIAPEEQIKIPFVVWLEDEVANVLKIDKNCMLRKASKLYSHDNIFHSLLGLSGAKTSEYNPKLDIFKECRK